mmetsp:Transcript_13774/g.41099  ORF Transcript_13774/g.41099 Transcript_13774/m.41099 type:complete len:165 (-) Transcript_13774:70-564(-)
MRRGFGALQSGSASRSRASSSTDAWIDTHPPQVASVGAGEAAVDMTTTVMMRHLPCKVGIARVLQGIYELGFSESFEMLYIPAAQGSAGPRPANLGYGFAVFRTPEAAAAFIRAFAGFQFAGSRSQKRGQAELARVQGFAAGLEMIREAAGSRDRPKGSFVCRL